MFTDDTETWMRELDTEPFRLVTEKDWGGEGAKNLHQRNANVTNANNSAKFVFTAPSAPATSRKPSNFRK